MKCADFIFDSLVALLLTAIVTSPVACTMRRDQLISNAIANGTPPMLARCAMNGTISPECQVLFIEQGTKK